MYSANGRIKPSKEVASKSIKNVFICKDCGHETVNKQFFGEKVTCSKCGSMLLELETVKQ